jgi:hypothetical protein
VKGREASLDQLAVFRSFSAAPRVPMRYNVLLRENLGVAHVWNYAISRCHGGHGFFGCTSSASWTETRQDPTTRNQRCFLTCTISHVRVVGVGHPL